MRHIPDLLSPGSGKMTIPMAAKEALNEAFYMGKSNPALTRMLAPENPGGVWNEAHFANDLFLNSLVDKGFRLAFNGENYPINQDALRALIAHPPLDLATIRFRQQIMAELDASDALLKNTRDLYSALYKLINLFNTSLYSATFSLDRSDMSAWRMSILRQVHLVFLMMANGFDEAKSGLFKIHQAGSDICQTGEFYRLTSLVEYDENLLGLDLHVRVGADGYLRDIAVKEVSENSQNPHYHGPIKRFLGKLGLVLRGYKFSDTELVGKIIDQTYQDLECWLPELLQLFGQLEFYLSSLAFRERCAEEGYPTCLPDLFDHSAAPTARLEGMFNPHLFLLGVKPRPCTVDSGYARQTLITGPNSGGKTRFLQAIALCQLMGQAGMFVPAANGRLHMAYGLFVSLIEEGRVDQSEGRLGTELMRIRALFEHCSPRAMILLDELCSGTNPSEGIEILNQVLQLLPRLSPNAFITTHFLEFARKLECEGSIATLSFIQVALNEREEPTYNFKPGVANTSLARKTARRLGVTLEELTDLINHRCQTTPKIHRLAS